MASSTALSAKDLKILAAYRETFKSNNKLLQDTVSNYNKAMKQGDKSPELRQARNAALNAYHGNRKIGQGTGSVSAEELNKLIANMVRVQADYKQAKSGRLGDDSKELKDLILDSDKKAGRNTEKLLEKLDLSLKGFAKKLGASIADSRVPGLGIKASLISMFGPAAPFVVALDQIVDIESASSKVLTKLKDKVFKESDENKEKNKASSNNSTASSSKKLADQAKKFFEGGKKFFSDTKSKLGDMLDSVGSKLSGFSASVKKGFKKLSGLVGGSSGAIANFLNPKNLLSMIGRMAGPALAVFAGWKIGTLIGEQINKMIPPEVTDAISNFMVDFVDGFKNLPDKFSDVIKGLGDSISGVVSDYISTPLSNIMGKVSDFVKDKFGWVIDIGKKATGAVSGAATAVTQTVSGAASKATGSASSALGSAATSLETTAKSGGVVGAAAGVAAQGARAVSGSLGSLSAKFESGSKGGGAVGWDSTGGASYGKYQIATKTGTMGQFLSFLKSYNPEWYKTLSQAGDPADKNGGFAEAWKAIYAKDPKKFEEAQHEFIKKTHYDPAVQAIKQASGVDISSRSKALQDVLWSTSVQHGPKGAASIFNQALKSSGGSSADDGTLISKVYELRRGKFGSSSKGVQAAVNSRFDSESQMALASLSTESTSSSGVSTSSVPQSTSQPVTATMVASRNSNSGTGGEIGASNNSVSSAPSARSYGTASITSGTPTVNVEAPASTNVAQQNSQSNKTSLGDIPMYSEDYGLLMLNTGAVA